MQRILPIVACLSGAYGNIGSEEADRFCLSRTFAGTAERSILFPDRTCNRMPGLYRERKKNMEKMIDLSQEQKEYAIDLLVTLVVEELEKDPEGDPANLLSAFVASKTGALLYDESSKLWWNGPVLYCGSVPGKNSRESCGTKDNKKGNQPKCSNGTPNSSHP